MAYTFVDPFGSTYYRLADGGTSYSFGGLELTLPALSGVWYGKRVFGGLTKASLDFLPGQNVHFAEGDHGLFLIDFRLPSFATWGPLGGILDWGIDRFSELAGQIELRLLSLFTTMWAHVVIARNGDNIRLGIPFTVRSNPLEAIKTALQWILDEVVSFLGFVIESPWVLLKLVVEPFGDVGGAIKEDVKSIVDNVGDTLEVVADLPETVVDTATGVVEDVSSGLKWGLILLAVGVVIVGGVILYAKAR